jgi:hypothetical protein
VNRTDTGAVSDRIGVGREVREKDNHTKVNGGSTFSEADRKNSDVLEARVDDAARVTRKARLQQASEPDAAQGADQMNVV